MKKDIEWLKKEIATEMIELEHNRNKKDGDLKYQTLRSVAEKIYQLDEPEVLLQEENINIVLNDLKEYIKEQQSLSQNVGLSHTSAGNDTHYKQYDYVLECINEYEPSDEIQNLLVSKQEEVDRAYKDGYKKGKEHATRNEEEPDEREQLETAYKDILNRGEFWFDDKKYVVVETVEITEEQVMEWLDNNDFYDHITAETVLERAVDKGELSYYGTKYSVIETPTIPQFVADFIKARKHTDAYNLQYIFHTAMEDSESDQHKKEYDWIRQNDETFARAWLDGYEVEEEPKYYVNLDMAAYVAKWNVNDEVDIHTDAVAISDNYEFYLTEQEIKNYDERFWAFAEPVEEAEEEPRYHALIKGYELLNINGIYWAYDKDNGDMFFSECNPPDDNFITEMSKEEWSELGINDSNADFVRVGEMEE